MGIRSRDTGWVLTLLVGAAALAVAVAALALRLGSSSEGAVIRTEAWPWSSNGVRVEPTTIRSPFRIGDVATSIDGRPLEAWVAGSLPGLGDPNPAIGDRVSFVVERDGRPVRLDVALAPFPAERIGSAPIGIVLLGGLVLVLATLLVRRRSRATALRLLFVIGAAHTADITAWELGLQPTDFAANVQFVVVFAVAGGFNLVFWSALVHLLLVYPTRSPLTVRRPLLIGLVYIAPFAGFAVLALIARLADGTMLDWVDRLAACLALVASGMLVAILVAIRSAWRRATPAVRRSVRWVAVSLAWSAIATLALLTLPIVASGSPILPRNVVDLLVLPVPVSLIVAIVRDRLFQVALLSRSREKIVAAREDERRRLRRDLHDGLAPSLAAVGLKLDHARNALRTDPGLAEWTLDEARQDVRAVIAEIRRMSRELRPPALDSLGLVGAVRQQAEALGTESGAGPQIVVESEGVLPALPAAVEVAAYRIAVEAMMNVIRHAAAQTCRVRMALVDDGLEIEVTDDGHGFQRTPSGVGVRAMRERAAEVGGDVRISAGRDQGTQVWARLPVDLSVLAPGRA